MTVKALFIYTTTGGIAFQVPADYGSLVSIEAIGGGGGSGTNYGGGGGAYAISTSSTLSSSLTPGQNFFFQVGTGGVPGGAAATDTWANTAGMFAPTSASTGVLAKAGASPAGGSASNCVGTLAYSGGNGGIRGIAPGGGGAAGSRLGTGGNGGDGDVDAAGGGGGVLGNGVDGSFSPPNQNFGGNGGTGFQGGAGGLGATSTRTATAGTSSTGSGGGGGGGGGIDDTGRYTGGAGGTLNLAYPNTGAQPFAGGGGGGGLPAASGNGGLGGGGGGGGNGLGPGSALGGNGVILFVYNSATTSDGNFFVFF